MSNNLRNIDWRRAALAATTAGAVVLALGACGNADPAPDLPSVSAATPTAEHQDDPDGGDALNNNYETYIKSYTVKNGVVSYIGSAEHPQEADADADPQTKWIDITGTVSCVNHQLREVNNLSHGKNAYDQPEFRRYAGDFSECADNKFLKEEVYIIPKHAETLFVSKAGVPIFPFMFE